MGSKLDYTFKCLLLGLILQNIELIQMFRAFSSTFFFFFYKYICILQPECSNYNIISFVIFPSVIYVCWVWGCALTWGVCIFVILFVCFVFLLPRVFFPYVFVDACVCDVWVCVFGGMWGLCVDVIQLILFFYSENAKRIFHLICMFFPLRYVSYHQVQQCS